MLAMAIVTVQAAIPFDSAKLSFVENDVRIGALGGGASKSAAISDTVKASDYVQTAVDSRAELTFQDNSIVRVGQSSLFTFEAASRTLSLKKGTMIFFVPPGSGGGNIKTPSLTAAITGTICKVSKEKKRELMAVLSGELNTTYGRVPAGWVIEWSNGKVRIYRFNPSETTKGKLFLLGNRRLPEEPEVLSAARLRNYSAPDLSKFDRHENAVLNPEIKDFEPEPDPTPDVEQPPDAKDPEPTPVPPRPDKTPVDDNPGYF